MCRILPPGYCPTMGTVGSDSAGVPVLWGIRDPAVFSLPCPGGAQGVGCLPTLPLASFLPPIPPTRARRALFPRRGRGRTIFPFARGSAPCIPATASGSMLVEPSACGTFPEHREGAPLCPAKRSPLPTGSGQPSQGEWGTGGRWNYPSLTRRRRLRWSPPPGRGRADSAGGKPHRPPYFSPIRHGSHILSV